MFKFINRRPFWLNAIVAILLAFLLIFGMLKLLGFITKHGVVLTVPKVVNTSTKAAIILLESKGFEVLIQDSVYTDTAKLGTVLKQFPDANSTVKVNRIVILTVNREVLPNIDAPSLIGKSQAYALEILARSHFNLGDTTFEPSYMQGAVISQNFKGVKLEPGTKIPWGSKIDLVIGAGLSQTQFEVPSLTGLTLSQAKQILIDKRLILASIISYKGGPISDTANAFVVQQSPPSANEDKSLNYIREGQVMDLYISRDMQYIVPDSSLLETGIDMNQLEQIEKENAAEAMAKKERLAKEKAEKQKLLGKNGALPKAPKKLTTKLVTPPKKPVVKPIIPPKKPATK